LGRVDTEWAVDLDDVVAVVPETLDEDADPRVEPDVIGPESDDVHGHRVATGAGRAAPGGRGRTSCPPSPFVCPVRRAVAEDSIADQRLPEKLDRRV
jgi:hypothetical protein